MPGFCPDEGEALVSAMVFGRVLTDHVGNMELGLFTNAAPGETITHAALTEPVGAGYARITLVDATWTGAADTRSYAQQTFTGGAGGWTGSVRGYFICTTGATKRIAFIELDPNGPYTINSGDTYKVTPNVTVA